MHGSGAVCVAKAPGVRTSRLDVQKSIFDMYKVQCVQEVHPKSFDD